MKHQLPYQILKKETLSEPEKETLENLIQACCLHDSCSLSCSFEPDTSYYLLYLKEENSFRLISAVSLLPYDDTLAECTAFTHPDCRRQGYFSALFDCVLEDFDETDLLFPLSSKEGDGLAVLNHLGAELQSSELQMELFLEDAVIPEIIQTAPDLSLIPAGSALDKAPDPNGQLLQLVRNDGLLLGSCQLSPAGQHCLCLHHVEILEPYRNHGYGSSMMALLIRHFAAQNICRIILQVSGDNAPALALYKKTGFRITETLSYYLY